MAEIRSTLDIIMEKTKDLTLTEEEKRAFRKKEVEGKVKGLLLKFNDGLIKLEELKEEITVIDDDKDEGIAMGLVVKDCLDRIDPKVDNRLPLGVLEHIVGIDITAIKRLLSDFHKTVDYEKGIHEQILRKQLQEKGISGPAVLPNIHAHQEWIHFIQNAKEKFLGQMQALVKT